jgi:hypothetical protein
VCAAREQESSGKAVLVALTLGQGAQLVASTSFSNRIRVAMVRAAVNVANETQGSLTAAAWVKRQQLATRILNSPDAWLPAFVATVSADPGLSLTWFNPIPITSSTAVNPSVITTPVHGFTTGDVVEIVGHTGNTNANGTWPVTVLTTTTFSIPQPGNAVGAATGTVQKMETDVTLNFTVNSNVSTNVFSAIAGLARGE